MPKRTDIKTILIIGAGPIIIGQACEFDYSGAQACKALREEGYKVVLVNSNPATIMTDPETADVTYIEPITWQVVERIIEKERPDAVLPTMGGQTALNCALDLARNGVLEKFGVELIGAKEEAIDKAEDRLKFKDAMTKIGLGSARSGIAHSMEEAHQVQAEIGFPVIIRPSFTLGGTGGGIAYNTEEFVEICKRGLEASPTNELLIEESLIGWKEYEMEVVRDKADNCIIVCSIENLDPMGVHTGDSITVAPSQTLTDKEYQILRNASIAVLREIGVDTGGSNVQFAINPADGRMIVIEMNPRVSRSSALASKATGFPIAKIAAKLAVGYTLDEIKNDITRETPASFEPTIDYVVVKIPRFTFEKFPGTPQLLSTSMKSVGEAMAIGRNFAEALNKALRSLEDPKAPFDFATPITDDVDTLLERASRPHDGRLQVVMAALRAGATAEQVHEATRIDPWFVDQVVQILEVARRVEQADALTPALLHAAKRIGLSDPQIASLRHTSADVVRGVRWALGLGVAVWSAAGMAHAFAGTVQQFVVARAALAAAESIGTPAAVKAGAVYLPLKERSLGLGLFNTAPNIGAILTPLLIPPLALIWGWRAAFLVTGGLGFVWLIFWWLGTRNLKPVATTTSARPMSTLLTTASRIAMFTSASCTSAAMTNAWPLGLFAGR